ncbi:hypothetical protein CJD36_003645 [Flavipsychrobacter stenotrophus]|uniref:Abasic site processing protein n=1 Tax=Flavipsychrobacter stenotrophus TaxID=2077091 RepID=A0A2S7T1P3_9BACT|nr:SOS response-associated peptidase family protein [Flavipsychrobacter stenotrophus]PQJ12848.1 hypothetical protein CJD36_003645 [Flavipsychrobacter stenotrophus]
MCNRVATPNQDQAKGYFDKVEPDLRDLIKMDKFVSYFHATAFTMPLLPKAEEIFDKRTYKDYILPKRGLLLLTGFYEGQEQPDKTSQPFYIYPQDGGLLTLGCVYSDWYNKEEDKQVKTFSIITTAANELMAEIHNKKKRMPLIIPPERRDWWLSKDLSKAELENYFVPFPNGYLQAHKVSRNLYKRGVDSNAIEAQMAL